MSNSSKKSFVALFVAILFGLSLVVGLLFAGAGALSAGAPLYVDDDNCPNVGSGTTADPFCTIQSAVNAAADLGEIRVAGGIYTGTEKVEAQDGWVYIQVFIIDRKSITVTGGYNGADWAAEPDPLVYPTIVDAERSGRGITVLGTGSQKVTLEGMTVTGGDYTGLGNPSASNQSCLGTGYDCGGGMRAKKVQLIMQNVTVYDNIASRTDQSRPSQGGGLDAHNLEPGSIILNSTFISNTAGGDRGYGGGIYLIYSELVIQDSLIEQNYAARSGGGLTVQLAEPVKVTGTSFKNNTAVDNGGALFTQHGYCTLQDKSLEVEGGYLTGNQAAYGSAILLSHGPSWAGDCGATLTNLILAKNQSTGSSMAQALISADSHANNYQLELNHITAADNEVPTFLYLVSGNGSQAITTTVNNTLAMSTTYGIAAKEEDGEMVINVRNPLMYDVSDPFSVVSGSPLYIVSDQVFGDPKLDADYHLLFGSAAINAGFGVGVPYDIDRDPRPVAFPDIGADEVGSIYLPAIIK